MKSIILNTATLDNGGARHSAGAVLRVGPAADEITVPRAQAAVRHDLASAAPEPAQAVRPAKLKPAG